MSGLPLVVDNAQCDLDVVDRERESFDSGSPKALGSSCAFGIMSESDFNIARGSMIDVDARLHYADWMDFRLGQQTALSWAGVDAFVVPIAAHPFLRWCALCGVAPSEQSLDAFAAIVNAPEIVVAARLDGMEFSSDGDAARNSADSGGLSESSRSRSVRRPVVEVPVRAADFEAWRTCAGAVGGELTPDAYARLLCEDLITDARCDPVNQVW